MVYIFILIENFYKKYNLFLFFSLFLRLTTNGDRHLTPKRSVELKNMKVIRLGTGGLTFCVLFLLFFAEAQICEFLYYFCFRYAVCERGGSLKEGGRKTMVWGVMPAQRGALPCLHARSRIYCSE